MRVTKAKTQEKEIRRREKISLALKRAYAEGRHPILLGPIPWNKGKQLPEEMRIKISRTLAGREPWNKGKTLSEEHKVKIAEAGCGRIPWNKGLTKGDDSRIGRPKGIPSKNKGNKGMCSSETIEKARKSVSLAWKEGRLRGYPHKEETKRLLSVKTKQAYAEGRLGHNPELERRRLTASYQAQHWRPNKPEEKLQSLLNQHFPDEWKYTGDGSHTIGGFPVDFTNINGRKVVIELFGDYWHNRPNLKWHQTELGRIMAYNSLGFKCLVIWEHELKTEQVVIDKITNFITDG